MKLTRVHVTNFRCIDDSNPVDVGPSTCLVGKNESGKTAFLKALEGLRSVDSGYAEYSKTKNYPRRYLADYDERHEGEEAQVISTVWKLDRDDKDALANELGEGASKVDEVTVSKTYGASEESWTVPIDERTVLHGLMERFALSAEEKAPIEELTRTDACAQGLEELENRTDSQSEMLDAIQRYRRGTLNAVRSTSSSPGLRGSCTSHTTTECPVKFRSINCTRIGRTIKSTKEIKCSWTFWSMRART